MIAATLLNTAWMACCLPEARAFRRATRQVAPAQAAILEGILRRAAPSAFGQAHQFDRLSSPQAFQDRVALSSYEDYAAAVDRIGRGEPRILTGEPVELLEPTSGTTAGEKLIPFTRGLRRQFQRAVAAWMGDLLWHRPALRRGRSYWSISPALPDRCTPAGVRIGFAADAEYLGSAARSILPRLLVAPPSITRLESLEAFQYATLQSLLQAPDLTLVSVWSPTFFTSLLSPLESWADRLCFDLGHANPSRAGELRAIFASSRAWPEKLRALWPRLALISCWADAAAAQYIGSLKALFPEVEIQPKGLLATEGCVSFPLLGRPGAALAVRSHFFEFQESSGRMRLAHELDAGGQYRVVLTTAGGLYRYQLRDLVAVVGFENECPLLQFLGKADGTSDLVGEKLAEPHVRNVIDRLRDRHQLAPAFALLVPIDATPPRYRLYLQASGATETLAAELEAGLAENPHYAYAVRLGQLAPAEVALLDPHAESAWSLYERACIARGMRVGNIKPTALDRGREWSQVFAPATRTAASRPHPPAAAQTP